MTTLSNFTLKRFEGDIKLLKKDPLEFIDASPSENVLTWHFLIRGQSGSHYENGWYIGEINFPEDYPQKPPNFMMLTPNGRFTAGKKICMTNTGYHSDQWSPMWNMHAILMGFCSIMLEDVDSGISHIKMSKSERKQFADDSVEYNLSKHSDIFKRFTRFVNPDGTPKTNEELDAANKLFKDEQIAEEKAKIEKKERKKKEKKEKAKKEKAKAKNEDDDDEVIVVSKKSSTKNN
jgi:ubiquitin-conjugating enzyme E2 J2